MRRAVVTAAGLALLALPALAAPAKKPPAPAPKDAADRFSLDLPTSDEAPVETAPAPAPADAAPDAKAGRFTLDTPIGRLLTDYRSKAVLDKDMPGLSTDKNLDKFKPLSLNRLAPLSGGRLTPELLEKVGKHLEAIK